MPWGALILGLVIGSCATTALIWFQRRSTGAGAALPDGYFSQVATSVVATAALAGAILTAVDYSMYGAMGTRGMLFGTGWLLGGLLGGWVVTRPSRSA